MKKVLLTRFGGIGDLAPMTVVGRQFRKRGNHVTLACRFDGPAQRHSDLFIDNPAFDEVMDLKMHGPWGTRCVKTQLGWASINSIYKDFDLVLDYMNIIESNNTSPLIKEGPGNEWQKSRNSNWRNWCDLHLEWANIDPTKVPDSDKRPIFTLLKGESEIFESLKQQYSHLFVVQTNASSLSRTWYQSEKLPKALLDLYPKSVVAFWDTKSNSWVLLSGKGYSRLNVPNISPLRLSMALIAKADVFIGADTGMSHIAEGLGVKHIAIYSTVPSWTRAKYYKFQTPIDPGIHNPEFYTFNLGLGDPLRVQEGMQNLTERERMVAELYASNVGVVEAAEALNTDTEGAKFELQSLKTKQASWERMQSKALSTIKLETVMEKVVGLVPVKD